MAIGDVEAAVIRTATDALKAKVSMMNAGYKPLPESNDIYLELLKALVSTKSLNNLRRQTPLVNASYATRVAIISSEIYKYIHYCKAMNIECVNFVLLGGGFDVIGLWAVYVARYHGVTFHVYDVDCDEVSNLKREAIHSMLRRGGELSSSCGLLMSDGCTYETIVCDLNQGGNFLRERLHDKFFDTQLPTLSVSELVLAYLSPDSAQDILSFVSQICKSSINSSFVCFEPYHYCSSPSLSRMYKTFEDNYFEQFSNKLNNNKSSEKRGDVCSFSTIGGGEHIVKYLRNACNFEIVKYKIGEDAASNVLPECSLITCELFDEHTALILHLRCYVLVRAFRASCSPFLISDMSSSRLKRGTIKRYNNIKIVEPEQQHDAPVSDLFLDSYRDLIDEYIPVQKMVKTALKSDLCADKKQEGDHSSIKSWYDRLGGKFWITVVEGVVVGCIGIRPRNKVDTNEEMSETRSVSIYEIQRLVVHEQYRQMGIAGQMLIVVEQYLVTTKREEAVCLIATTPALMNASNNFYQTNGFYRTKEIQMGINMVTYEKLL